jgi:hypothetical protein
MIKPPSKTKRKELVRELIDPIRVGQWFDPAQVELFNELTGFEFQQYKKVLNPNNPNEKVIRNIYVGEIKEMRSWLKQIDYPEKFDRRKINAKQAMRNSIVPEIMQQQYSLGNYCEYCGSQSNLTVDHKDVPFNDMAEAFLDAYPDFETHTPTGKMGHFFKDPQIEQEWLTVHNTIATYQLLCRSCNSKKGTK